MQGALRAGLRVIQASAKVEAPADGGDLRDSLRIRARRKSRKFGWVRMDLVAGNKKAWYAHLLHNGTASYYTGKGKSVRKPYKIAPLRGRQALLIGRRTLRKSVIHPGIKPNRFMSRAVQRSTSAALDATVQYIQRRLPREIKKVGST